MLPVHVEKDKSTESVSSSYEHLIAWALFQGQGSYLVANCLLKPYFSMTAMFLASAKYLMRCLILETALCAKCCDYSKPTY